MSATLVAGGTVFDGSGAPGRPADIRIDGDRIAGTGPPGSLSAPPGSARIDAAGLAVAPGFIDLHSHGDLVLAMADDERRRILVAGRLAQGITTEIVGNCGLGPAPCSPEREEALRGVLAWMTPGAEPWPWRDVGGYLDHLERRRLPLNVGALAAHGALRIGEAGLDRRLPSASSIGSIGRALELALDQGAFGMSVGLIYPPGSFTPSDELMPLARILGRRDALLTAHVRGSSETLLDAVEEILACGREGGARVHHSHNEAVGPAHWDKIGRVLAMEDAARRSGARVTCDMFPYTAAATTMAAIYPPWALEGGIAALVERLGDPETRDRIRHDVEHVAPAWPPWNEGGWAHNLVLAVGWERITVGSVATPANRRAEGLDLADLARREGKAPFDAIADLMIAEGGRISQVIHGISGADGSDAGLLALMTHPATAICTDANDTGRGLPHPAAYGTFPRILGTFVRERKALTLAEAIRKMTSWPAEILGLEDRGRIAPGAAADLVLFDPESVGSDATFREPRRLARGIRSVLVNGEIVCQDGEILPVLPGRVLRRRG